MGGGGIIRFLASYRRDDTGATAVEFGIVSLFFITLIFAILEMGSIFWTWNNLQYATEATARYALTNAAATDADLQAYAGSRLSELGSDSANLTVTVTHTTASSIDFVEIGSSYNYQSFGGFLDDAITNITLTATSRTPVP